MALNTGGWWRTWIDVLHFLSVRYLHAVLNHYGYAAELWTVSNMYPNCSGRICVKIHVLDIPWHATAWHPWPLYHCKHSHCIQKQHTVVVLQLQIQAAQSPHSPTRKLCTKIGKIVLNFFYTKCAVNSEKLRQNCKKMSFGTNLITINSNFLFLTQFGHKLIKFNLLVY